MNRKESDYLMMIIMAMTLLIIFLFSVIKINAVVHGAGVIITKDNTQIVSLSKGGTIKRIFVAEGDFVKKGQVLAETANLDLKKEYEHHKVQATYLQGYTHELNLVLSHTGPAYEADISKLKDKKIISNIQSVKSRVATKDVKINGLSSDIIGMEITRISKQSEMNLLREEINILRPLVKKGISSYTNLLNKKQMEIRLKSEISDIDNQISSKKDETRVVQNEIQNDDFEFRHLLSKDLTDAQKELSMSESALQILNQQVEEASVASPVDGIIYRINKNASTQGGVIQAADSLFEIKPLSTTVLAEVKIQPKDRDQIYIDGDVNINVLSYLRSGTKPYQGTIEQISPDSYEESVNGSIVRYYKMVVKFNVTAKELTMVKPGMTVDASVITGKHSILQYLASPLLKGFNHTFSEPVLPANKLNAN